MPTEMTVGDRTYEILGFLQGDEKRVVGHTMVKRAKEKKAHLGEDDGQYLLDHKEEIPEIFKEEIAFIFTDWCASDNPGYVVLVDVDSDGLNWTKFWWGLNGDFGDNIRILRRIKPSASAQVP
jgi:hypothetical protein